MKENFDELCERAIRLLSEHIRPASELRKPTLLHGIRVGTYLYVNNYSQDVVLAGYLHDILEQSPEISEESLANEFGKTVSALVVANSKDESIVESSARNEDMIQRCVAQGEDALIVKSVDILDSFSHYERTNNAHELENHCKKTAELVMKHKPVEFSDPIFLEVEKKLTSQGISSSTW